MLTTRARILLPYVLDVFKVSRNVLDLVSLPDQNLQPVTASRTKHKQMAALRILSNDRSYSFGRRSNPQRMSVASLAIQIRPPCAGSIACKLGSPIILRPLPPRAVLAHVPRRIPSSRSGFGRSSIGFQHPHRRTCSVSVPSLTLPGNSSACPAVAASSRQKSTAGANRAHGKTHSPICPLRACSDTSLRHFAHAFLNRCVTPLHCHEPRAFTRWGSFSSHSFSKWLKYSSQVSSRRAD